MSDGTNPSDAKPASHAPSSTATHEPGAHGKLGTLVLGAIGVVFGDIGTSPLYTLKECLSGAHGAGSSREAVLGVISMIVWALTLVVTVKYLVFIMRAHNRGEGGIFALLALLPEKTRLTKKGGTGIIAILIIAGAALLYGDGMITPAISVLSAVEGVGVAVNPDTVINAGITSFTLKSAFVPVTCVILFFLFYIQKRGTQTVGRLFGPVMVAWFVGIGALGAYHLAQEPGVLRALNPMLAAHYFQEHGLAGVAVLGSVVLAVTGGEALYADMGHFGSKPIRAAWLALVFPSLALCYLGQGALVLRDEKALDNPFFAMSPNVPFTYVLVVLATLATVIASQALISGAYSLTHQAVQLGFFPRVTIKHTASDTEGQIYVPQINWLLAVVCLLLVIGFKESGKLAAAYGIAVTGTMGITSIAFFSVTRNVYKWPLAASLAVTALFLSFDIPFFGSNILKFWDGGYVPIAVGAAFFTAMLIWKRGRRLLGELVRKRMTPTREFIDALADPGAAQSYRDAKTEGRIARAPGTGIFMCSLSDGVPPSLAQLAERIHVVPERIALVTIAVEHVPEVAEADRIETEDLGKGVIRVIGKYGFMERPDVPVLLRAAAKRTGDLSLDEATYFFGKETFLAGPGGEMGVVTESIFAFLARNAPPATTYFSVPTERVVELGSQIDL
jgi:KUP system potassium uptake protein